MNELKSIVIIPARFGSTRFPGKPLARISSKSMIQHVYERVMQAQCVSDVWVATDDLRIVQAVTDFGGKACMTSSCHRSGTDRVAELAGKLEADLIVNVQGDEPLIDPRCIDAVVEPFRSEPELMISTLKSSASSPDEFRSPNVVKVVTDRDGYALYFSRSPIPYSIRATSDAGEQQTFFKHIGLYVYRKRFLELLPTLKESVLEKSEALEQLRFLENGFRIKVVPHEYESIAVDTPADLERVNRHFA
jgi:3-deoxy-manno-octulosonate cytidylyltransferase (CMP-KDO synthetase)